MLKLARLRGGGSFNPKKDGPLMTGASLDAEPRGGGGVRAGAGAVAVGEGSAVVAVAVCAGTEATAAAGADNSVAPHMPQKRFPSGFSLPQRAQRTDPPRLYV